MLHCVCTRSNVLEHKKVTAWEESPHKSQEGMWERVAAAAVSACIMLAFVWLPLAVRQAHSCTRAHQPALSGCISVLGDTVDAQ